MMRHLTFFCVLIGIFSTSLYATPTDPIITITIAGGNPANYPAGSSPTIHVCTNTQVQLTASSTGTGTITYEWLRIGQVFHTGQTYTGTLLDGSYRVKITDDSGGLTSATEIQVCVSSTTPFNAKITPDEISSICQAANAKNIILQASAEENGSGGFCTEFVYQWSKDGQVLAGETNPSLVIANQVANIGTYSVILKNACGNASPATFNLGLVANSPQNILITSQTGTNSFCAGQTFTLQAQGQGNIDVWEWFKDAEINPFARGESIVVSESALYRVKALNGCGEAISPTFEVKKQTPITNVSLNPPFYADCKSSNSPFLVSFSGDEDEIEWYKDNILVETGDDEYIPLISGDYKAKVINACNSVESATVPTLVVIDPTYALLETEGSPSICTSSGNSVKLLIDTDGNELTCGWFFSPDNVNYTFQTFTTNNIKELVITQAGFYKALIDNGCGSLETNIMEIFEVTAPPTDVVISSGEISNTCSGAISLTCDNAGNGTIYRWYQDNNLVASTYINQYTATQSGVYQVKAENACGSSNQSLGATLDIQLTPNNAQIITDNASNPYCWDGTGSVLLQGTADGTNLTYTWLKNGMAVGSGQTFEATEAGDYQLRVENTCNQTTSSPFALELIPNTQNVAILTTACSTPIEMKLSTTFGSTTHYQWYQVNGSIVAAVGTDSPDFQTSTSGKYFVKVFNDCNSIGATSSIVDVVTGVSLPKPVISLDKDQLCMGETAILTANITGSPPFTLKYQWFKNEVVISEANQTTYQASESGLYRVEIYAESNNACRNLSDYVSVFVRPEPTIFVSFNRLPVLCVGDSIRFQANAQITPIGYHWYKGNEFLKESDFLTVKDSGVYKVEAIYDATVLDYPCQPVISNDIQVEIKGDFTPRIESVGGLLRSLDVASSYQWYYNGIPILEATASEFFPLDSGRYSLLVSNEAGCLSISDEIYHAGLYPETDDLLTISPNPNQGTFSVTILSEKISSFVIYNQLGELVFLQKDLTKVNSIGNHSVVEINKLPPGVYVLSAETDDGLVSKKLIIF
jgi:hypothetical protein